MSYTDQNKAIRSRFHTNWGTDPPVKYDNADFTPPDNAAFVAFEIVNAGEFVASLGGPIKYRNFGIISINIYAPLNSGTKVLSGYCDTAAAIFRGQQFSSITCLGASVNRIGEVDGRFVYNVSIDFFRDEDF
jgi:hypothetical protein